MAKRKRKLYDALGVAEDAKPEAIKRAFRRRARETHPDKGGKADDFALVVRAYRLLSDPSKRRAYDATGEEPAPQCQVEAAAQATLVELFLSFLEAYGEKAAKIDAVKEMRVRLERARDKERGNKASAEKRSAMLAKLAVRMTRKQGDNVLAAAVEAKREEEAAKIERSAQADAILAEALVQLESYAWAFDAPDPAAAFYAGMGFAVTEIRWSDA